MATKKKAAKAKAVVTKNLIKAYKPVCTYISISSNYSDDYKKLGGWDDKKGVLTPVQFCKMMDIERSDGVSYVLDSIALAMEAGVVDGDAFVKQMFKTRNDFDEFCAELQGHNDYWMNERHFYALLELIGDEYCTSNYQMAGESLEREYE